MEPWLAERDERSHVMLLGVAVVCTEEADLHPVDTAHSPPFAIHM